MDTERFKDLVRAALGDLPQVEAAQKAGISPAYISVMLKGRVPTRKTLRRFAVGLGLDQGERTALLEAAGYVPETEKELRGEAPAPVTYDPELDTAILAPYGGLQGLPEGDVAALGEMLRTLRRARNLDQ